MKNFRNILYTILATAVLFVACDPDDFSELLTNPPANIDGTFTISDDNTGTLTVVPTGENVIKFTIDFGDDANADPTEVEPGKSVSHVYAEGNFTMTITGIGADDQEVSAEKAIVIQFDPPENLVANITTSNRTATVAPTADGATLFQVYFGEVDNEEPTVIMPGENAQHVYEAIGDYTVRVVAKGAGAATIEVEEMITITESITLPVNFEAGDVSFTLADFGNASSELVDNPFQDADNGSDKVFKFTKPAGAEVWAGTSLELGGPIDFSSLSNFKMKVYSPKVGAVMKFKVENAADGNIAYEVDVTNTVANGWETLIWDFSNIDQSQEYSKIALFFDFGNAGDDSEYFFDDIEQTNDTPVALELPIDFENANINYSFTDFGNAFSTVVANPDMSGINTSATVAQLEKTNGAEVWAGSFIQLPSAMDLSGSTDFNLKVWSPKAGATVRLKIENESDGALFYETDQTVTNANTWEQLTFDLSAANMANSYHKIVVFMDFGNPGDGSKYYFDDMQLGASDMDVLELPLDFESATLNYAYNDFGNAFTTVVDNPDMSGVNTSGKVSKTEKTNGAETWAGSFIQLPNAIDFSGDKTFRIKTWSPKAGATIRLKVENESDGGIFHEIDATTTTTNAWEELTWDFSGIDTNNSYHKVVIFFDFGNAGDGSIYYFDDIELRN